jgi:uncharacterized delta-60 repeat protein
VDWRKFVSGIYKLADIISHTPECNAILNKKMKVHIVCFVIYFNALFAQDGTVDVNFNSTLNLNNSVYAIKQQADGKILIGGSFNSSLFRLNNDGSTDSSFNALSESVSCIGIQNDNKILIGSNFIKRLNSNGSIDNSFSCILDNGASKLKILDDGKIIICGYFSNVNGTTRYGIAKLNSNGSLDTSFNLSLPPGTGLRDFEVQNDGKIIISGEQSISVSPYINLIFRRYNTNNTIDNTFNVGGSNADSNIADIEIQSDNKIMICGFFNSFNGQNRACLARLNSNGTLDTTFNSYNFTSYSIFKVKILNDGKYIITGSFNFYDGQSSNKIAKLNNDGTIDTSFTIGTAANDFIWATEIQNDGKIIIGGDFTIFNTISKNRIARLGNTILSTDANPYGNPEIKVYPNPAQDVIFIENSNSSLFLTSLKLFNSIGQELKSYNSTEILNKSISLKELPNAIYYLQITTTGKIITKKIIKK